MNPNIFAEWLKKQGHAVIQTESSFWYDAGPRVFQAFPYGAIIEPTEKELRTLLLKNNIAALRYSTPVDAPLGCVSYHVVLQQPYAVELLNHQARNNIQRGLRSCRVEPISLSQLAEEGWELQYDTLQRQGRVNSMNQGEWQRICHSAEGLPGFEAWGAIIDGKLTASILTVRIDDTYYVPYAQSLQQFTSQRVNHALFYIASCEMLSRSGIKEIFFSLQSLDAPESVNEFKFRMGLLAKPIRQRVVIHPLLKVFANPAAHRLVMRMMKQRPESPFWSKTEGMLRFFLQGKKPIGNQEWPDCILRELEKVNGTSFSEKKSSLEKMNEKEMEHA